MKKMMFLLCVCASSVMISTGCNQGPGVATEAEAKKSMDDSMMIDTAAEAEAAGGAAGAGAGADTGASATP